MLGEENVETLLIELQFCIITFFLMCFNSCVYDGEERNYFSETMSKEWMYDNAIMFHFVFPFQINGGNGSRISTGHAQSIYNI